MKIIIRHPGEVLFADKVCRCAVGRGGIGIKAGEGDGITPVGVFPLRSVFFRPDRLNPPRTGLPVSPLLPTDGWCDDPGHSAYNQQILLPATASHEALWREDSVYDVIVVIGYNDDPVEPGKGSAIFMHLARPLFEPTEGCIALEIEDLLGLLECCDTDSQIDIMSPR